MTSCPVRTIVVSSRSENNLREQEQHLLADDDDEMYPPSHRRQGRVATNAQSDATPVVYNTFRNSSYSDQCQTPTQNSKNGQPNRIVRSNSCNSMVQRLLSMLNLQRAPSTPLQQAMQRARRFRRLRSVRFWLMLVSGLVLVCTIAYYCVGLIDNNSVKTMASKVYKTSLEKMPNVGSIILDGSSDVSNHEIGTSQQQKQVRTINAAQTWMFGYSTRTFVPTAKIDKALGRPHHIHTLRHHKNKTTTDSNKERKRVMVNLVSRQFASFLEDSNGNGTGDDPNMQPDRGNPNPAVYGWTPSSYPNPKVDPQRCGISYIIEDHNRANVNVMATTDYEFAAQEQSPTTEIQNITQAPGEPPAGTNDTNDPNLRLCDPDWMLGGVLLEEVADAMYNFSQIFSEKQEEDKPWDVAVSGTPGTGSMLKRWFEKLLELFRWTYQKIFNGGNPQQQEQQQQQEFQRYQYEQAMSAGAGLARSLPKVELAVATVRKMNLLSVLRQGSYYAYEDQDDMVSDAAQIFARTLHDAWWRSSIDGGENSGTGDGDGNFNNHHPGDYGILLFLSIQDRICFISTGSGVQHVLPWWRLDHIVASMKPDLRHQQYGTSVVAAIHDLTNMLLAGPPSLSDRFHDFITRFGVVIAFAAFTFVFGAWGEYRDRRKRWQYAEQRSKLTDIEREKALQLQKEFNSRCCPICLESFNYGDEDEKDDQSNEDVMNMGADTSGDEQDDEAPFLEDSHRTPTTTIASMMLLQASGKTAITVDHHGVPLRGADGKKIRILRCGHIFCDTCWKSWVHSGCGNPCICPVCRQDVGKTSKSKQSSARRRSEAQPLVPNSDDMSSDVDGNALQVLISNDQLHDNNAGLSSVDSTMSTDSMVENLSSSLQTSDSMALDMMPLVGGGPSFLLLHSVAVPNNSNCNNSSSNDATGQQQRQQHGGGGPSEGGERTPLLLARHNSNNNESYTISPIESNN